MTNLVKTEDVVSVKIEDVAHELLSEQTIAQIDQVSLNEGQPPKFLMVTWGSKTNICVNVTVPNKWLIGAIVGLTGASWIINLITSPKPF